MIRKTRLRRRRGVTLNECLVMIFLISTTLTAIACGVHALYRAEQRLRDALDGQRNLARFDIQLREDAHQAVSVELAESGDEELRSKDLVLSLPEMRRVRYSLSERFVQRTVSSAGAVTHRETYALPGNPGHWVVHEGSPSSRIALRLDRIVPAGNRSVEPPPVAYLQTAVGIGALPLPAPEEVDR